VPATSERNFTPTSAGESTTKACGAVVPKIVTLVPGGGALVFVKLNVADEDDAVIVAVTA
jgi:hypothetical protein